MLWALTYLQHCCKNCDYGPAWPAQRVFQSETGLLQYIREQREALLRWNGTVLWWVRLSMDSRLAFRIAQCAACRGTALRSSFSSLVSVVRAASLFHTSYVVVLTLLHVFWTGHSV